MPKLSPFYTRPRGGGKSAITTITIIPERYGFVVGQIKKASFGTRYNLMNAEETIAFGVMHEIKTFI